MRTYFGIAIDEAAGNRRVERMTFVLRHKSTGSYLKGQNEWTPQLEAALQFDSGLKLVRYLEWNSVREKQDALEVIALGAGMGGLPSRAPL